MTAEVTHGIRVSVDVRFAPEHSDVRNGDHVFVYDIRIANNSDRTVQLLRRHWHITDSLAEASEVEGPGVVGETPILGPGEEFAYSSMCALVSGFGRMEGTYSMLDRDTGRRFEVRIPAFELLTPWYSN
ncbi:MAG: Co2+/Mg2+ efflux protein ApaG [Flavobacteriales bacterium]|nr:Co2+/Mg2+ efflux protein ApaG [Flavobacteriales bacterium]